MFDRKVRVISPESICAGDNMLNSDIKFESPQKPMNQKNCYCRKGIKFCFNES